ncbi:helix-turn-helix domain-containing protein [Alicyclobacillus mengziensis]|uniref:Helix-turn-helix domain-containing protein n=1 Tax=Alicyclobacillus mengziensis TaxID=2931921 RepID=A0A9X7Z7I3_9BACL|nr:helix-turn-helix domain-containing protein [Alicyclobacillus mengziensis]
MQRTLVERAIDAIGVPLHLVNKTHKMKVVQLLDENGFFLIRDSVTYLAQAINVTCYTIYNKRAHFVSSRRPSNLPQLYGRYRICLCRRGITRSGSAKHPAFVNNALWKRYPIRFTQ